jgi:putative membrane protein
VRQIPLNLLRGFAMGAADIVPGVSGGTVALVLGIYRHLVESIRNGAGALGHVLKGDIGGSVRLLKAVDWAFLVTLLVGVLSAVVALSHVLETALEGHPVEMAGLFLGLVAGSVVIAWGLLTHRTARNATILAVAAVAFFLLLGLSSGVTEDAVDQVDSPAPWLLFGSGAIAICAMILPGISGSFLLVVMGMYGAVLGAVTDRDLVSLVAFGLGCLVGLAVFSQVLHWALEHHHDTVMAVLIGLMLGSLRVLWPWPGGVESTELAAPGTGGGVLIPAMIMVLGLIVVLGIDRVSHRLEHRDVSDDVEDLVA